MLISLYNPIDNWTSQPKRKASQITFSKASFNNTKIIGNPQQDGFLSSRKLYFSGSHQDQQLWKLLYQKDIARSKNINRIKNILRTVKNIEALNEVGATPLIWASGEGKLELVKFLLANNANVHAALPGSLGQPIHVAASKNHVKIVELLLNKGADIEAEDSFKRRPLHIAAREGWEDLTRFLLDRNATIDVFTKESRTALRYAAQNGHSAIVKLLLDRGAGIDIAAGPNNQTHLHAASQHGRDKVVQQLLDAGASLEAVDANGNTPLHTAIQHGKEEVVKRLLANGADKESRTHNSEGKTPLQIAAQFGHKTIVTLLLEQDAQLDATDSKGDTALDYAILFNRPDIVELLCEKAANVNSRGATGQRPLHRAVISNKQKILEILLQYHANIQLMNDSLMTPTSVAIMYGHPDMVESLLPKEVEVANANALPGEQLAKKIRFLLAARLGHLDQLKQLVKEGIDPKSATNDSAKITALHFACMGGHENIVNYIIDTIGISPYTKDASGRTAFEDAVEKGHLHLLKLFLRQEPNEELLNQALHKACRLAKPDVVEFLLTQPGVNPNIKSSHAGYTALHEAALPWAGIQASAKERVIQLLLDHGTRITERDASGQTALSCLVRNGYEDIALNILQSKARSDQALLPVYDVLKLHQAIKKGDVKAVTSMVQNGVDIHDQDEILDGLTPLHTAARYGQDEIAKLLIKAGANINAQNKEHTTPLLVAIDRGHTNIVKLLLGELCLTDVDSNNIALLKALGKNRRSIIRQLLEYEANNIDLEHTSKIKRLKALPLPQNPFSTASMLPLPPPPPPIEKVLFDDIVNHRDQTSLSLLFAMPHRLKCLENYDIPQQYLHSTANHLQNKVTRASVKFLLEYPISQLSKSERQNLLNTAVRMRDTELIALTSIANGYNPNNLEALLKSIVKAEELQKSPPSINKTFVEELENAYKTAFAKRAAIVAEIERISKQRHTNLQEHTRVLKKRGLLDV